MKLRNIVRPDDPQRIREIVSSTGFFREDEIEVAVELCRENLKWGEEKSSYSFIFADDDSGRTLGYTCYGDIPCTLKRYDLYWIAVHADAQGKGIGKMLLSAAERSIAERGGKIVYIETSSRDKYEPTRRFYLSCGYQIAAQLKDFYDDGDDKVIFSRRLR